MPRVPKESAVQGTAYTSVLTATETLWHWLRPVLFIQQLYFMLADPVMPISPTHVAAGYPHCKPFESRTPGNDGGTPITPPTTQLSELNYLLYKLMITRSAPIPPYLWGRTCRHCLLAEAHSIGTSSVIKRKRKKKKEKEKEKTPLVVITQPA